MPTPEQDPRAQDNRLERNIAEFQKLSQELKNLGCSIKAQLDSTLSTVVPVHQSIKESLESSLLFKIKDIVRRWVEITKGSTKPPLEAVFSLERDARLNEVNSLMIPMISAETWQTNPRLAHSILEHILEYLSSSTNNTRGIKDAGLLLSLFLHRSLQEMQEPDREKIHQVLDLTGIGPLDYLGWRHLGGKLTIIGDTGNFAAHEMAGGKIVIAGNTGDETGAEMLTGKLSAQKVGKLACRSMHGGDALFWQADESLGYQMKGGEILVQYAGSYLGSNMEGGTILAHTCGDFGGIAMKGGTIIVHRAERFIGQEQEGGEIRITGGFSVLGGDRRSGRIVKPNWNWKEMF